MTGCGGDLRRMFSEKMSKVKNAIKGIEVEATHRQPRPGSRTRRQKISDIDHLPAGARMISVDDREISIAQYFEQKYMKLQYVFSVPQPSWSSRISLALTGTRSSSFVQRFIPRHPELPCAVIKQSGKYRGQVNYIPLECLSLCHGQQYTKQIGGYGTCTVDLVLIHPFAFFYLLC